MVKIFKFKNTTTEPITLKDIEDLDKTYNKSASNTNNGMFQKIINGTLSYLKPNINNALDYNNNYNNSPLYTIPFTSEHDYARIVYDNIENTFKKFGDKFITPTIQHIKKFIMGIIIILMHREELSSKSKEEIFNKSMLRLKVLCNLYGIKREHIIKDTTMEEIKSYFYKYPDSNKKIINNI